MSAPQKFRDLPAALAAYRAGACRRWVEVDGWQIDLVQAAAAASRVRDWTPMTAVAIRACMVGMRDRDEHDRWVASNVCAYLARVTAPVELPPLAEPAISSPPVECCRACGRPLIGGAP